MARAGRRVLRLKGGDPFIFGRGGEEARALVEARVPFRVVPGITAGIGGLAYAGIPATTRDTNAAITFVTGHAATGDVPDSVDWTALARGASVLVIYMAVKHLETITGRLMAGGRSPDEPLAFICQATTARSPGRGVHPGAGGCRPRRRERGRPRPSSSWAKWCACARRTGLLVGSDRPAAPRHRECRRIGAA